MPFHYCVIYFDGLLKGVKAMLNSLVFILQFTCQFGVRDFLREIDDDNEKPYYCFYLYMVAPSLCGFELGTAPSIRVGCLRL